MKKDIYRFVPSEFSLPLIARDQLYLALSMHKAGQHAACAAMGQAQAHPFRSILGV